jgi:hypothetical protein
MLRQDDRPIQFQKTRRMDNVNRLTSGAAGVIIPVAVAPLLREDSAAGRIVIDMELAEMPKPLENAVIARGQTWFVPRPALPQFAGIDDYRHAYHGTTPTREGGSALSAATLFPTRSTAMSSNEIGVALGLHTVSGENYNLDYFDAYQDICNFRLAAHSSKATKYLYRLQDGTGHQLRPAFWPKNRMHQIVPDYESALVKGSLDLDVTAGQIPVSGIGIAASLSPNSTDRTVRETDHTQGTVTYSNTVESMGSTAMMLEVSSKDGQWHPDVYAEMADETISTSLMDIDKARTTQAFAKRLAAFAGSDYSGFSNEDLIMSEFMQGFETPEELMLRPWLLDNKTVVFGMTERHATDAANLDDSSTTGRAGMVLNVNVPKAKYGGIIMATVEVLPERLYERQEDPYMMVTDASDLPNPMRDIQRTEPVDIVLNRRIDTAHTTPDATFGYEPMNEKWQREFTALGGEFRQDTPGTPATTARTAIWQADYVDPVFTSDHYVAPHPFPQDVFSAPSADIVNIAVKQQITIVGQTQFGDALVEDNDEMANVIAEQSA